MNLGYIGIGIMGRAMAGNLLHAGHTLYIQNRTPEKCEALAAEGAIVCRYPSEVAEKAKVIFINVTDTQAVEDVLFGLDGVFETAATESVIIDNSTISPAATRDFARRLKKQDIHYLDAPVSGGDIGAQKGTLSIMVGGNRSVFEKYRPLLEILGSKITYVGPVGMGQTCKAINQLFCALHMLACCEGIALAKKAGLDSHTMVEVVTEGAGGSWALDNLGPRIINGHFEPGFMIDLLVKDLRFTLELAREYKQPLIGTTLVQQLFQNAQDAGYGKLGTQALYRIIEAMGHTDSR